MKSGVVKLLDARGVVFAAEFYKSEEHWKRILSGWKHMYGDRFPLYYIQFAPDAKEVIVGEKFTSKPLFR